MATARLVPSTYYLSSTYLTVNNASNMYDNTDSNTYGTVTNTRTGTSSYYIYLRGFNFDAIPNNAQVTNIEIKIKASQTGGNTGTIQGYNGTNVVSSAGSATALGGTADVKTFTNTTINWNTLKGYGDNFGIRINCRRNNRNTQSVISIYGVEIVVTYTAEEVHPTSVSVSPSTASVEVGNTVQLTETVLPNNATNKSVTWSSSNPSVATVDSDGLVTGVSAGNATITVTTVDGGLTDTCAITVTPAVTYEYILTDTMEVGKNYLIANGNSGSVRLLTNESGGSRQLVGALATVNNNKITITGALKDKAEFTCVRYTAGNDVTITVSSDGKYLYSDNATGLRMNAPATLDRFWHYRDHKFWQFKSSTNDGYSDASNEYKYYLTLSGNNFTDNHVTSPSIEDSNIPLVYIFEPYVPSSNVLYVKKSGAWKEVLEAYKKVNGAWVQQSDLSTVFNNVDNFVCGD